MKQVLILSISVKTVLFNVTTAVQLEGFMRNMNTRVRSWVEC